MRTFRWWWLCVVPGLLAHTCWSSLPSVLSLTTTSSASASPSASPSPSPSVTPGEVLRQTSVVSVTPEPVICVVDTGYAHGAVNLRECGSLRCSVVALLYEMQTVQLVRYDVWSYVVAEDEHSNILQGWVYSLYIACR